MKVDRYSLEFKLTGVRLSEQPGIQIKAVAAAPDIHPFMLSRWRKQASCGAEVVTCACHLPVRFVDCRSWSARTCCCRRSMSS
jgi:transposase-like protein